MCPDVSIVIPVHDGEESIGQCIQSIMGQSYEGFVEVICIDDASIDGSWETINGVAVPDGRMLKALRNESNLGPGLSRDRGVREASGRLLMFCDSDDFLDPGYLGQMVDDFNANQCDILVGSFTFTDGAKERTERLSPTDWTVLNFSAPWGKLYETDFIKGNGVRFEGYRFAEDTYFTLRAFCAGATYAFSENAGYHYVENRGSITRSKSYDKDYEGELSRMYRNLIAEVGFEQLSTYQQRLLEYSYISDMLNTLVMYDRGCGREFMSQKAGFFLADLRSLFPDYRNNPYIGLFEPRGQRTKIRLGMGAFMLADKLGMAKRFLMLFA